MLLVNVLQVFFEKIIDFLSYFKNITSDDAVSNMNNGSVIPNNELSIILGSNANNATPTKAIFSSKNFLHKKYTGIVMSADKNIEIILSNCIY